jgi:hypothetical protein
MTYAPIEGQGELSDARMPTDLGKVRVLVLLWTFAVIAETVVFGGGLLVDALGGDAYRGPSMSVLLLGQIVSSVLFPASLLLIAKQLRGGTSLKRLAQWALTISVLAWVTYDVCGLYRLLPLNVSVSLAGIRSSSLVSIGWWTRNVEVVVTVLLFSRLLALGGGAFPRRLLHFVIGIVAVKIVFFALSQFILLSGGMGIGGQPVPHNAVVDTVTYVTPLLQRASEIAVGIVVARGLSRR